MSGKHDDLVECGGSKPPMSLDLKIEWERERRERAESQRREARRNLWENVVMIPILAAFFTAYLFFMDWLSRLI